MNLANFGTILRLMLRTGLFGALISAVLYTIFYFFMRRRASATKGRHILNYVFLTYIVCVPLLVFAAGMGASSAANNIPLRAIFNAMNSAHETTRNIIILNIIVFVPMGVLLPLVFRGLNSFMKVVLTTFLVTLSIELVQIFIPGRVFDIDDIILNTLGGAIGYSLYCFARALLLKKKPGRVEMLASIASLAVVPLFIVTVLLVRGEFVYPFTQPVPLPGEIECALTADEPEEALIWKKADYDEKLLESRLFAAFGEMERTETDASWLYYKNGESSLNISRTAENWHLFLRTETLLPPEESDEELISIAEDFISEKALLEKGIEVIEIVDSPDIAEDGKEKPIGKCAVFRFRSGEAKGMIYLYFDSLGIYGIWTDMKRFEKYKPAAILSAEEALSAAEESGNCIMDFTGEFEAKRFNAEELSLDYWESMDGRYNLPVWKFSGSYLGDSGERIEGYIAVPALE